MSNSKALDEISIALSELAQAGKLDTEEYRDLMEEWQDLARDHVETIILERDRNED